MKKFFKLIMLILFLGMFTIGTVGCPSADKAPEGGSNAEADGPDGGSEPESETEDTADPQE